MRASTAQLQYDAAMPSSAAERRGILVHIYVEVVLRFSSSFDKVVYSSAIRTTEQTSFIHEAIHAVLLFLGLNSYRVRPQYFKVGPLAAPAAFVRFSVQWRPLYRVR